MPKQLFQRPAAIKQTKFGKPGNGQNWQTDFSRKKGKKSEKLGKTDKPSTTTPDTK